MYFFIASTKIILVFLYLYEIVEMKVNNYSNVENVSSFISKSKFPFPEINSKIILAIK